MRTLIALVAAVLLAGVATAQSPAADQGSRQRRPQPEGFSTEFIDRQADACTDFYQFACGNWLAGHPLPADRPRYGRLHELADRNATIVRRILEQAAEKVTGRTPNEQKIGDAYTACMDQTSIERNGARPALPLLREIDSIATRPGLIRLAARYSHDGYPSFLTFGAAPDPHDSAQFIATLGQGALGLPDRDLYLNDDERSKTLRREYATHIQRMFELLAANGGGSVSLSPRQTATSVMQVETAIARATLDRVAFRDPRRRDNPTTLEQLRTLGPNIDFAAYFGGTGAPRFNRLNLLNPQYIRDISGALDVVPLAAWKAYMKWRALDALAHLLASRFEIEQFRFNGTVLSGQREMRPRWMRCSDAVAGQPGADAFGEIVGQIFIEQRFGADAAVRMMQMIAALQRSLRETLSDLDWMSAETRTHALAKLDALSRKIGGPDKWRTFDAVTIVPNDYAGNAIRIAIDDTQRQLSRIGQPVDRSLWLMTPQTVNAYYSPQLNEIVFPAGILQPPFFDATKDDAVNFGAVGAMIGHELSHGFDDSGRRFDARGNLTDWWTPRDDAAFRERASCIATQYSAYTSVPGARLNGNLTLGENVADNAGLRIAYLALMDVLAAKGTQLSIDGFTPDQRFFIAWAQVWCENATDQDFRRRAQEDVHASGRWRANGVLQNSDEFRKAFGCKRGAPMAPVNACRVW